MSVVVKKRRSGPIRAPHARTARGVGGVRSEAPISRWRAGQRSAPAPVPRWSIATIRQPAAPAPRSRLRVAGTE